MSTDGFAARTFYKVGTVCDAVSQRGSKASSTRGTPADPLQARRAKARLTGGCTSATAGLLDPSNTTFGMAAYNQRGSTQANTSIGLLPRGALIDRMQEEISRAQRHGTPLGMLLLRFDEHGEIRQAHGQRRSSEMFGYTGGALTRQLRRFDRLGGLQQGELLALLPGADIVRSEVVARRVLARLRAIEVEIRDQRRALPVHASIAQWTEGQTAELLIEHARGALVHEQLGFQDALGI